MYMIFLTSTNHLSYTYSTVYCNGPFSQWPFQQVNTAEGINVNCGNV